MRNEILGRMIEVKLTNPENFLKIKETLMRIGIASKKTKTLYQSCHIYHDSGRYYIAHFKDLFLLEGKKSDLSEDDERRRTSIAMLLSDWGLLKVVDPKRVSDKIDVSGIKVLSYAEKKDWALTAKYNIGKR